MRIKKKEKKKPVEVVQPGEQFVPRWILSCGCFRRSSRGERHSLHSALHQTKQMLPSHSALTGDITINFPDDERLFSLS